MTRFNRFKSIALKSARFRKHTMSKFKTVRHGRHPVGLSNCKRCGAGVAVHTCPAPDGIDIHGTAVAINCKDLVRMVI